MFGDNPITFRRTLPNQNTRARFVPSHKRRLFAYGLLLFIVNLNSRMISGRAEELALVQVSRIYVGSGVNEEGATAGRNLYAQRVVVLM